MHLSLWNDEGNYVGACCSAAYGEIAAAAAADIHPPGYYWLLKSCGRCSSATAPGPCARFSAVLGVLLVLLVATIGRRLYCNRPGVALACPCWPRCSPRSIPFQIYYSQEARMYMLLAVEAAGLFWALLWMMESGDRRSEIGDWRFGEWEIRQHPQSPDLRSLNLLIPYSLFIFCGAAGLWTHYSFPIVLAAAGLAYVVWWLGGVLRPAAGQPPLHRPARACCALSWRTW